MESLQLRRVQQQDAVDVLVDDLISQAVAPLDVFPDLRQLRFDPLGIELDASAGDLERPARDPRPP